jgi:nucleoside-diphosphate-sugar epimerase
MPRMFDVYSALRLPLEDVAYVVKSLGKRWEFLRRKRILLTGGTGFVGKWLLGTFLQANIHHKLDSRLIVLSRRPQAFIDEFPQLASVSNIEWLAGDIRDLKPDSGIDCSYAIHAATDVAAPKSPLETLDSCSVGTRRLMDAMAAGSGARRVLILSSGAVYGSGPVDSVAIPETWSCSPDPLRTTSAYGEGKRVSELLGVLVSADNPGLEVAIARCFSFVGPHLPLDKHFAIGNFIAAAIRGDNIDINGDGSPIRSYLYAADLARWLWMLLFEAPNARAYNVGGNEFLSIRELALRVNHLLGGTGVVRVAQRPPLKTLRQAYVPSIKRIMIELNLKPSVDLDEAILRTAKWARSNF